MNDTKTITVAILVRVSKRSQRPDRQISELQAVANARDWQVVETIVEHGVSGAADDRPGIGNVQ